ncbi:QWRF motif-containing protein 2-like [Pistacia vera]|uniref:QWRF motif-containing protein 2-like n=1 Tax=Pistacia vera TaxID=55513 RepID=UPI001262CDB6|nr:QWRF motif-containing protein 2-like [Pistacia vera]
MVAAVSTTINNSKTTSQNRTRPPLLPSDPENALANRRPKSREVTSRYLSSSSSSSSSTSSTTSKRCPSPLVSRTALSTAMMTPIPSSHSTIKRSQSVERRRPVTPRSNGNNSSLDVRTGEISAAQKMLFTSARSLSVSFQGESFSLQVSKAKPAPSPSPISAVRKGTPERRKAITPARGTVVHTENSKLERWPGRLRQPNSMSRSVDYTDERKKLSGGSGGNVVRALQNSMVDNNNNRALFETRLSTDSANALLERIQMQKKKDDVINGSDGRCDLVASDTESVSSGSNSEAHESNGVVNQGQRGPRGIVVPARFWHETNNRLRRQTDPGSPISKNNGLKTASTPKLGVAKKFGIDSPVSSPKGVVNTRGLVSPIRGAIRPASPSKLATSAASSPVRGVSPSRIRNLVGVGVSSNLSNVNNTPSILSFAADVRRGKIGENRVVDAHLLRLFYNRLLQWRFANARADAALSAQRWNAERSLYNAWITTSKLRESVRAKRTELQLLRQNLKLTSILRGQMMYLEESSLMERDYSSSLLGAIEALRASTLRLPVVGGQGYCPAQMHIYF